MAKMKGARLIAQMLKAHGVTHVFFMDAILRRALAEMEDFGITRMLGHSEKAVAYMADGYARVSGRPGVCMAQSVGAANLASGMQDPYLGHSPVIAISGRHVAPFQYRNAYQEVDHGPLYAAVTKFHGRDRYARTDAAPPAPGVPRSDHRHAAPRASRHGGLHRRCADAAGRRSSISPSTTRTRASRRSVRRRIRRRCERAVAAIKKAKRPVIVADRGAIIAGAGAAVAQLAERIQAPVVATLDAKAHHARGPPLFRGTVGLYGRGCANHVVAEADLVIYAGSNTSGPHHRQLLMPKQGTAIIQIDIDPLEIGRNYAGTIGMLSDVRAGLEALAAMADAAKHDDWLAHTQKFVDEWRAEAEKARNSDADPMRPERLVPRNERSPAEGRDRHRRHRLCRAVERHAGLPAPSRRRNISARPARWAGRFRRRSAPSAARRTSR